MTEEIQGSDNSELDKVSALIAAQESGNTEAPATEEVKAETTAEPAPETQQQAEEKLIPQSQVAKIAAREKREAEQKMQALINEQRQRHEAEMATLRATQNVTQSQAQGQPIDNAQMAKAIQAEVQRMAHFNQAHQIAEQFEGKIKSAIMSDPDFGDIYDSLQITKFPNFAVLANQFDNTAEIVKEMGLHPRKYAEINTLINAGLMDLARKEMANLSASIKQNESAKKQTPASQPLSQLKPSQGISVSDDAKSVEDFRKIFSPNRRRS